MERKQVLEKHKVSIVSKYTEDKREEEIVQLLIENWSAVDGWTDLSVDIQKEFNSEKLEGQLIDENMTKF